MDIKVSLGMAISKLRNAIDVAAKLSVAPDVAAAIATLQYAETALEGDECAMYWAWVQVTLAAALVGGETVNAYLREEALTEQEQETQMAGVVQGLNTMVVNLETIRDTDLGGSAYPGLRGAIHDSSKLIGACQRGDEPSLNCLSNWVREHHSTMQSFHHMPGPRLSPSPGM